MQPADVFRISLPRTDLNVTVEGVQVKPSLALGSYAAFKQYSDTTMVMGDLVLLDEEVNPVMSSLLQSGFEITGLHNHLNGMSPHVMYMHYMGRGDAVQMASALRNALAVTGTPLTAAQSAGATGGPTIDTNAIEGILGYPGKTTDDGVLQFSVPRANSITSKGMEILPSMGVAMPLNFQPTGDGKAAITGDFVLIGSEVNAVCRALRDNGIEVTAIHNHLLDDEPRIFYLHFWANDDALKLARGLRAALDQTNVMR